MIQATKEHHLTLETTDSETSHLAHVIHNMNKWLHEKFISEKVFVQIHDTLREGIGTENFISVVGYRDEREEKNEYAIRVIEFPVKSDGNINKLVIKDEKFYMVEETKGDN